MVRFFSDYNCVLFSAVWDFLLLQFHQLNTHIQSHTTNFQPLKIAVAIEAYERVNFVESTVSVILNLRHPIEKSVE